MRGRAAGVHDPFRNPLVVKMEYFFAQDKIFEQGRAARAGAQRVLVIGGASTLIDGAERPRNHGTNVPKCGRCDNHMKGSRSMKQITTIGLDLAEHVFQVHGAEADSSFVVSRKLRRTDMLAFIKKPHG